MRFHITFAFILLASITALGQWNGTGGFIEPNNNNQGRSVRLFRTIAGAERGY